VGLFALANPIIERWAQQVPDLVAPLRIGLWMVIGLCVWGVLRARLRGTRVGLPAVRVQGTRGYDAFEQDTGSSWITRSLVLFNAVFAVQTALDIAYLYGGRALPDGMTYAEYAHRGAYPLIATALLAGLFVLLTFRPGGVAERSGWARRLVYLWIAQNVLLVVSSAWRLSLYVDVYSLTRLRVAAGVWMLLVALALVLLVVRIALRLNNRWLVPANTVAAGLVLYACCFVGFDRLIADYNVRHSREIVGQQPAADGAITDEPLNAPLDVAYLESLGPDALPALRWFAEHVDGQAHAEPRQRALAASAALSRELDDQLIDWRGWTLRRAQLARAGVR